MSKRKSRGLRPEEEALWQKVIENAKPMHARAAPIEKPKPTPRRTPSTDPVMPMPGLEPFRVGSKTKSAPRHDLAPDLKESLARAPVKMDRKAFQQLKRGKLKPEARLDLHGMTLAQAHPALNRFILGAQAQGKRLVLVITGKGKDRDEGGPIPQKLGVLRHQVPHWLQIPPLSAAVLQVSPAHLRHGGAGAYYVYLRKR
ncbi:Smr/MutS family protein [Tropicimonas sp. S265A]|uniref:Smr/MutS family protein n=1 Tax=Tropicimonas sp. S265A TaxID=3415134 RepID=UPI003C7C6F16